MASTLARKRWSLGDVGCGLLLDDATQPACEVQCLYYQSLLDLGRDLVVLL